MVKCWVVDVVVVRGISKYYTRRFGKALELILQCWVVDVVAVRGISKYYTRRCQKALEFLILFF